MKLGIITFFDVYKWISNCTLFHLMDDKCAKLCICWRVIKSWHWSGWLRRGRERPPKSIKRCELGGMELCLHEAPRHTTPVAQVEQETWREAERVPRFKTQSAKARRPSCGHGEAARLSRGRGVPTPRRLFFYLYNELQKKSAINTMVVQ